MARIRKFAPFYHVSANPSSVLAGKYLFYILVKEWTETTSKASPPLREPAVKIRENKKTVKLFLLQHTEAETKQVTSAKLPHGTRTELFSAAVSLP